MTPFRSALAPKIMSFWPLRCPDSSEGGNVAWRNDTSTAPRRAKGVMTSLPNMPAVVALARARPGSFLAGVRACGWPEGGSCSDVEGELAPGVQTIPSGLGLGVGNKAPGGREGNVHRSPRRSPGKGSRMPVKRRKRRGWDCPPKATGRGLNGQACRSQKQRWFGSERRGRGRPAWLSNFNNLDY